MHVGGTERFEWELIGGDVDSVEMGVGKTRGDF
jgi:hypothetical protein